MRPAKTTAWAIITGRMILPYSVRSTRKQCIHDFLRNFITDRTWEQCSKSGHRCAKVLITEETP